MANSDLYWWALRRYTALGANSPENTHFLPARSHSKVLSCVCVCVYVGVLTHTVSLYIYIYIYCICVCECGRKR